MSPRTAAADDGHPESWRRRAAYRRSSFRRPAWPSPWPWPLLAVLSLYVAGCLCNSDAKRLYDDLLSNYNRLIRPVSNNTDTVLVKLGLRLSQLIELVRVHSGRLGRSSRYHN